MITDAVQASGLSNYKYRIGAAIYDKRGRLLSLGHNQKKTHPTQLRYATRAGRPSKVFLHAEISALVKCRGEPYSISVVRVSKTGLRNAYPCPICMAAILEAGIKKLVWTGPDGSINERLL